MSDDEVIDRPDERRKKLDGLAIEYALALQDDESDERLKGMTW